MIPRGVLRDHAARAEATKAAIIAGRGLKDTQTAARIAAMPDPVAAAIRSALAVACRGKDFLD